jgi:RNA polymerase sigma-70 factor (ECF subfamily)
LAEVQKPTVAIAAVPDHDGAFATFFAHRNMLRAYLLAMLRDAEMADDVLSDVAVATAHSWRGYDRTLPFGPWARGIARRVALKRLRKLSRAEVMLPDDVLDSLGAAMDEMGEALAMEAQKRQLRECLQQLSARNRELVRLRYHEETSFELMAQRLGRSLGALYTAFSRIHASLLACLQKADNAR